MMSDELKLELPNGKTCYVTSRTMRIIAKFLRWEIFSHEQYMRAGFELRPDDTVIDVGANIGMFALWAQPQIARGKLICVEPNPHALKCLAVNIRRNKLDNVTVVAAAVGGDDGIVQFTSFPGLEAVGHRADMDAPWFANRSNRLGKIARMLLPLFSFERHSAATAEPIAVQQKLLARIMDDNNVTVANFLKMDCEGSECEILRSLEPSDWRRIERAVIEFHDFGAGRNHDEITDMLCENGFEVEVMNSMQTRICSLFGVHVRTVWAKRPALAPSISSDGAAAAPVGA